MPKFSILVNSSLKGSFGTSCSPRQGINIFPYLFIIQADVLGRNISRIVVTSSINGFMPSSMTSFISHQ